MSRWTSPRLHRRPGGGKEETAAPRRGAGYISDPKKRKAIELHAEDLAVAHYEAEGWTVERLGKPYDLRCTRGTEERHVEVKGTTGAPTSVELTINEVLHARDKDTTVDLYVVSDITIDTHTVPYTTSGGEVSHYLDWEPAEQDLRPRRYEYRLPLTSD
ncbi:protein NO VEIN domain-containing protein [Streptomyces nogalater]